MQSDWMRVGPEKWLTNSLSDPGDWSHNYRLDSSSAFQSRGNKSLSYITLQQAVCFGCFSNYAFRMQKQSNWR